jgi:PAS domain S-box-containing protein
LVHITTGPDQVLKKRLAIMSDTYINSFADELVIIAELWNKCNRRVSVEQYLVELTRHLGRMIESGTAFGFSALVREIQVLEFLASSVLVADSGISNECILQWDCSFKHLKEISGQILDTAEQDYRTDHPGAQLISKLDSEPVVSFIVPNSVVINVLKPALIKSGFKVRIEHSVPSAGLTALSGELDVLVIDLDNLSETTRDRISLEKICKPFPDSIPKVVLSNRDDISLRLKVIQAGIDRYVNKPVDPDIFAEMLKKLISGMPGDPFRIMILEDDEALARFYARLLERFGMIVTIVNNPIRMSHSLMEFRPELLLLGERFAGHTGLDLTRSLRQQEKYAAISIILIRSHAENDMDQTALKSGVDDILVRPVQVEQLITMISARANRARGMSNVNKDLQQAIRRLENQQQVIDRHSAVQVTNHRGEIISVNDKFLSLLGYKEEELLGKHNSIVLNDATDNDRLKKIYTRIEQSQFGQGEICLKKKAGTPVWVLVTVVPFFDDIHDKPYQYVATMSDISSRVMADKQLQESQDKVVKANQAKSRFISHMSHELRTPMNAILGFAQLQQNNPEQGDPVKIQQYAHQIYKSGQHLMGLINEILDLSRIENDDMKVDEISIPLTEMLDECCALIEPLAKDKDIIIEREYLETGEVLVHADPLRLKQVFINLLSNAVKYNVKAGKIRLQWQRQELNKIRIEISDTGTGVPPDQVDKLFQPFARLSIHQHQEGIGIGLALCKSLVELMGGEIGVTSRVGEGAIFFVVLQGEKSTQAESKSLNNAKHQVPDPLRLTGAELKVLYIEDNQTNYEVLQEMLTLRSGYVLTHAVDAETGLHLLAETRPDLILMDLQLPGMNGFEALEAINDYYSGQRPPVIVISANIGSEVRDKTLTSGFDAFISKPVILDKLYSVLDSFTNRVSDR